MCDQQREHERRLQRDWFQKVGFRALDATQVTLANGSTIIVQADHAKPALTEENAAERQSRALRFYGITDSSGSIECLNEIELVEKIGQDSFNTLPA
jgi:hypothetical protein